MRPETVQLALEKADDVNGYRFLFSLIHENPATPQCRHHRVEKVHHSYGSPLLVCPVCFPSEVLAQ